MVSRDFIRLMKVQRTRWSIRVLAGSTKTRLGPASILPLSWFPTEFHRLTSTLVSFRENTPALTQVKTKSL